MEIIYNSHPSPPRGEARTTIREFSEHLQREVYVFKPVPVLRHIEKEPEAPSEPEISLSRGEAAAIKKQIRAERLERLLTLGRITDPSTIPNPHLTGEPL